MEERGPTYSRGEDTWLLYSEATTEGAPNVHKGALIFWPDARPSSLVRSSASQRTKVYPLRGNWTAKHIHVRRKCVLFLARTMLLPTMSFSFSLFLFFYFSFFFFHSGSVNTQSEALQNAISGRDAGTISRRGWKGVTQGGRKARPASVNARFQAWHQSAASSRGKTFGVARTEARAINIRQSGGPPFNREIDSDQESARVPESLLASVFLLRPPTTRMKL